LSSLGVLLPLGFSSNHNRLQSSLISFYPLFHGRVIGTHGRTGFHPMKS
jgi:hypothetical protein